MSTPLTDSINALTASANSTTGASDTNLSDAVQTLISGYGGGGGSGVTSGTYTPASDSSSATIDTGKTGWTHFLIVPHTLPYATAYARCLGCRFYDMTAQMLICAFGSSSAQSSPNSAATYTESTTRKFSETYEINGTVITFKNLVASQGGTFQAGTQYDWYVW